MQLEKRAHFNLLRMNWEIDPASFSVEPWQVEDYRSLPTHALFHRCHQLGIDLDRQSFQAYAERFDTPEELTIFLVEEMLQSDSDIEELEDKLYLPVFELWRRLVPEKQSLTVFCDELDYQIYRYDQGRSPTLEELQDALANLQLILEENAEEGNPPKETFAFVTSECANDLESFLYDFISDLLDDGDFSYANELLEGFRSYVSEPKWFDFLGIRIQFSHDILLARQQLEALIRKAKKEKDLEFDLEILTFMVQHVDRDLFEPFARHAASLIKTEGQFSDLLYICSDFYRCSDHEQKEKEIESILHSRESAGSEQSLSSDDKDLKTLLSILRKND